MAFKAPKILNPLWIISLFICLTETVLGLTLTNVQELPIKITLTAFVVFFPILISVGFFILLWYKSPVLYSPQEFSDPQSYSDLMDKMHQVSINVAELNASKPTLLEDKGYFEIEFDKSIFEKGKSLIYKIDAFRDFDELTDEVYFAAERKFKAYSYGTDWILENKNTSKEIEHARMIIGETQRIRVSDTRNLSAVGINSGDRLIVKKI